MVTDLPGYVCLEVQGKDVAAAFSQEAGGHQWQRIPPTERRGRVQTSTITVVVLPLEAEINYSNKSWGSFDVKYCRGSGPGGQHRNKKETAAQVTHRDSGLTVRIEDSRSREANREKALAKLKLQLRLRELTALKEKLQKKRKGSCGLGKRGDKRRSIKVPSKVVKDHVADISMSYKDYLKGKLESINCCG